MTCDHHCFLTLFHHTRSLPTSKPFLRNLNSPLHLTLTKTLLHKTAAPRQSSQGQVAAGPLAPRQLAARPSNGERRYSQPAEPRSAPRPGMGLEGGQQGVGPTAEQRCLLTICPFACFPVQSRLCVPALLQRSSALPLVLLIKAVISIHRKLNSCKRCCCSC